MSIVPKKHQCKVFVLTSLAMAIAGHTYAQDGQATTQEATPRLEEILVTAQNREQSIQDVPISMNVLDTDAIERAGINDVKGISNLAPDFFTVEDANSTRLSLRGIGTQSNDEAQDQSMTVAIDGEYVNRGRVLNTALFDLERIEVLRGPQGTLYGRNATGGAINVITRKPSLEDGFQGNIAVDGGNFDKRAFNAAANLPLGETAAARVAVMTDENSGYNHHPNFNEATNEKDVQAARVGVLFEPTTALSIYLAAETAKQDTNSITFASIDFNQEPYQANPDGGTNCSGEGWEFFADVADGIACVPTNVDHKDDLDPNSFPGPITGMLGKNVFETNAFRAEVSYDFDTFTLSYRGGYRDNSVDVDEALPDLIFYRDVEIDTFSNELRLSGETSGGIFWQTGAFFFNEEIWARGSLWSPFINFMPDMNGAYINPFYRPDFDSNSKAVFGQTEIPLSESLTAVVGARYTDDKKTGTIYNIGFTPNFNDPADLPPIEDTPESGIRPGEFDNEEVTWNLGLNYEPNSTSLIYAKVNKGYKAGGFDSSGSYDAETVIAYEVGTKTDFERFSVSGSAFYYDYEDLQAAVIIDSTVGSQIFNAGAATIWGGEVSAATWITDKDRLSFSVNYLNAQYDTFESVIPVQCVNCDEEDGKINALPGSLDGNKLPHAPEWIVTLGYDHVWDFSDGSSMTGSIFSRFKDNYHTTIFNFAGDEQDGFTQTDVSMTYVSASEDWELQAYARNLEDERPVSFSSFVSADVVDVMNYTYAPPRTYGLKLTYNF